MRLVETKNGLQYFAFEHSKSYQKIQFEFLDAVESLNPQNITVSKRRSFVQIQSLLKGRRSFCWMQNR